VNHKTGHIMWMLDGYTTMADYPYSQRSSLSSLTHTSLQQGQADTQINYIRNSVKATVDAYDGTVKLYQWDNKDPVLKSWMSIFPGLVDKRSAMPADVLDHVRYPQDLFDVQRGLLAQYHISKPTDAYNGKGKWAVPPDPFADAGNQPSYYVLANKPGESGTTTPQFQLTSPMVVNGGTNLASYVSVDCDPGSNYGKITVLQVPGKSAIQGPSQIANVFKNTAPISKDISLLGQGQSSVLHGNLLTLPLGDSFLYVEPLYVQSTASGAYPTLQRVLVLYGNDRIGYGGNLQSALDDIELGRSPGSSIDNGQTTAPSTTPSNPTSSPTKSPSSGSTGTTGTSPASGPVSQQQLVQQVIAAKAALDRAYDTHDPLKVAQAQSRYNDLSTKLVNSLNKPTSSGSAKSSPAAKATPSR
jgi:uncharacterized protein